jgi:hypothetical protein
VDVGAFHRKIILSLPNKKLSESSKIYTMTNYLLENWISIVALIISLVSLITGLVARYETKQVQLEEKYNDLRIRYHNLRVQIGEYEGKLNLTKSEYTRVMRLLSQLLALAKTNTDKHKLDIFIKDMQYFTEIGDLIGKSLVALNNSKNAFNSEHTENVKEAHNLTKLVGLVDYQEALLKSTDKGIVAFNAEIERIAKILENPDLLKAIKSEG